MKLSDIHFHDSIIIAVIEVSSVDELHFDIEYPVNWSENGFSRATIVFSEIQGYEVHEAPFHGSPTILDYEVLGENANRVEIKLLTNAGYRRFSFESVDIQWPQKNKNLVEEQFFSGERDALVKFVLNDAVQIKNGEHAGELGSVVGQVVEPEMLSYVVELANGQGDVTLHQASLVLVGAADEKT